MKKIMLIFAVSFLFTGCGLYNKYENKVEAPAEVFGQVAGTAGDTSLAQMSWRSSSSRCWPTTPT